jgi:hypothetical protein
MTSDRHLGRLEELAQLDPGGVDDPGGEDAPGDAGQDIRFDEVGRVAPRPAAEGRTAVVAALGAALGVNGNIIATGSRARRRVNIETPTTIRADVGAQYQ